eukprot:gnl/Dysnectes_brevis/1977_a2274_1377.p1 GENE.gnl/Dysnectes_brevis/1977_a2274_1377~~gnl/Dysnectes_brevis/1977_a2274_1377.p1  ORF type:complete len:368 (-),score=140.49 gnl/Dysnectes_brevis/1977_a2274_1377:77-1180(-)
MAKRTTRQTNKHRKAESPLDETIAPPTKRRGKRKPKQEPRPTIETIPAADYDKIEFTAEESAADEFWRDVFFCGTELPAYSRVFANTWRWPELGKALLEKGELWNRVRDGKRVYLWGGTEPQLISGKMRLVPWICSVVTTARLDETLGLGSVQMDGDSHIPMSSLKMGFAPLVIDEVPSEGKRRAWQELRVWILGCRTRRAALSRLPLFRMRDYQYAAPFVFVPKHQKELLETTPRPEDVEMKLPGTEHAIVYSGSYDKLPEYAVECLKEAGEAEPEEARIEEVCEALKSGLAAEQAKWDAWSAGIQKQVDEMSPDTASALDGMEIFKFYPYCDEFSIDGLPNPFVNRYVGRAHYLRQKSLKLEEAN